MNRKTNEITVFISICLTLVLLVAGCNQAGKNESPPLIVENDGQSTAEPTSESDTAEITIALVMKTLTNPFFVEMEKGARQAEAELGINLLVKTGAQETSVEQQITIIDNLIEDRVDAIVIAPADSTELLPVLKKGQDAGIVIINVDNQLDPEAAEQIGLVDVPYISVDNEHGAYLSAKYISDQMTTPTQVAILEGIRTANNARDRKDGALQAFGENSNVEVVAMETAHWKIDEAYDVTAQLFEQRPDIGALFCANDMMALGTLRYLEETGRTDVLVAAYDALEEAKEAIRAGTLEATNQELQERNVELETRNAELQEALDTIKTLSGLIPICAWCGKKVCDDTDQWISLETYVEARSEAKFSHGICPDCLKTWRKKDKT